MSRPEASGVRDELASHADRIYEITSQLVGEDTLQGIADRNGLRDETVQRLLTAAVRLYVATRVSEPGLPPFYGKSVTATDVAVTARAMLRAVNMEVFELGLWSSWAD